MGCATSRLVKVRSRPYNPLAEKLKLSAWRGPKASERTTQILRRHDLLDSYSKKPQHNALPELMVAYAREPRQETCYAISELSYLAGKKRELGDGEQAMQHYFTSVLYAYEYLFHPRYAELTNPYDPQFRGACDLYNVALEAGLRQAQKRGELRPGHSRIRTVGGRKIRFSVRTRGFKWHPREFNQFRFVSDYKLTGLTNKYETHGLGVPLIAVRSKQQVVKTVQDKYYAPNLSFPVTAFMRLKKDPANPGAPLLAELELYDPTETTRLQVSNYKVPLESDISTPLAFFLDNPKLKYLDTYGLVWADKAKEISGLYMLQPYQPGKIPVLMVHGLWSSPMTWMEMLNDLRGVPEIRDRYQFLFYLYPSGQPFWETTADLRDSLKEFHLAFSGRDQEHRLDQMVVVGHSMGGIVSRMLTSYGGDVYWNKVSQQSIRQVSASNQSKQQFQRLFYFQPERSVRRVITIGSPNRGSRLANNFTQWLGRKLISVPGQTFEAGKNLLKLNPRFFINDFTTATSIDSLSPNSPILQANQESRKAGWVTYHNIVGAVYDKPLEKNSDGVVPYQSAHLTDVASEIVVKAEHSKLHRHPRTVLEVQRILLDHLQEVDAQKYSEVIHAGQNPGPGTRPGLQYNTDNTGHSQPLRLPLPAENPESGPGLPDREEPDWSESNRAVSNRPGTNLPATRLPAGEWKIPSRTLAY